MSDPGLDSLGARAAALAIPTAVRANVASVRAVPVPHADVDALVLAAGAPALVAAHTVDAVASRGLRIPSVLTSAEALPPWVDARTLILSMGRIAPQDASAHVIDLSPAGARPAPVAESTAALALLGELGLVGGISSELLAAADHVESVLADLDGDASASAALARRIGHTMALVYGAGPLGAAAAASWKNSVNRNAKVPAFANSIPGLDHDEVCGWAQHGDVTRQVFTLVVLRHPFETPDEARRLDITAEICDEIVAGVHFVRTDGDTPVAALFDLMAHGEMVSLDLAAQSDVDPGPTPITDLYR